MYGRGLVIDELDRPLRNRQPWCQDNFVCIPSYRDSVYAPLQRLGTQALSFDMPSQRHQTLGRNVYVCVGLPLEASVAIRVAWAVSSSTSTVSSTLITPGCRSVRSFLRAFLARGRRERLVVMSKEKMLQFDPSSWDGYQLSAGVTGGKRHTYTPGAVVQGPDGLVDIDNISEGIREGRTLGNGRCYSRLQEIHGRQASYSPEGVGRCLTIGNETRNETGRTGRTGYEPRDLKIISGPRRYGVVEATLNTSSTLAGFRYVTAGR